MGDLQNRVDPNMRHPSSQVVSSFSNQSKSSKFLQHREGKGSQSELELLISDAFPIIFWGRGPNQTASCPKWTCERFLNMDLTKNHQGIGVKSWYTHSYLIHPSTRQYTAFPARCASVCHGGMPCHGAIVCCLLSYHDTTSLPQGRPLFEARVTWSSQNVAVSDNGVMPPPISNLRRVFISIYDI